MFFLRLSNLFGFAYKFNDLEKEDNGNEVAVISFMYYRLRCRRGAYRLWCRTKLVPALGYKEIKSMVVDILKTDEGKKR